MGQHKALFAALLKNLGHPAPSDADLDAALQKSMVEIKKGDGVDPDQVKYKLSLTPIDTSWVKNTFG